MSEPGASGAVDLLESLQAHLALCNEVLRLVVHEHDMLRGPGELDTRKLQDQRKDLLVRLTKSLNSLSRHRSAWQRLSPAERAQEPRVAPLLRSNMDLIMRIILLDRENEQLLLRRGLVPAGHLPSLQREQPHFVSELYRRNSLG
jgi:hypothetical protein